MPSTNWGHLDTQPPLSKEFIVNYSNNIARGLEFQAGGNKKSSSDIYCLKCKKKVKSSNEQVVKMKDGRRRIAAKCTKCNGNLSKILPKN